MGSLGSNRGHHWAVIWATSSPLAISLTLSWWFGNGRWCSDELAVNFTTDHSFAIMLRVFFSSLFVWILQLCASWNVLCNSGLSYFTWTPWSLTENTLKSRKKNLCKEEIYCFFLIPSCHTLPWKVSRSTKSVPAGFLSTQAHSPWGCLTSASYPRWPQDYQN